MRPNIAHALTAAFAIAGAAGAIVLPTLTLADVKSPPHVFAIPTPSGDVVIEADRLPEAAAARPVRPTRALVVTRPTRSSAPVASPRSAAPVAKPARVAVPKPLPTTPAPQPESTPAPEPSAVRTVASVAPVGHKFHIERRI